MNSVLPLLTNNLVPSDFALKGGERTFCTKYRRANPSLPFRPLPSMGITEGSFMEGEMARFSATAASARRPRALRGGVEESLGRLARLVSPAELDKAAEPSRFRSEGSPDEAGLSSVAAAFDSLPCPLEPSAMKSPGGG